MFRESGGGRWRAIATGVLAAFALPLVPQREGRMPDDVRAKLTTLLADVAAAVPQDPPGRLASQPARADAVLPGALSNAVQDARRARTLRLSESREVQVYVLMREVTDDTVRQLTEAGATVEIRDAGRRRVQARVPVWRLEAVAALAPVTFVRLPTYAVRHVGAATTEGDSVIRSDAVRRQLALDGTTVRVGVLSDGIKGIFAGNCTTCGGVPGGPLESGDLPAATGTRNARGVLTAASGGISGRSFQANGDLEGLPSGSCAFAGAGAEGTALLEIVHDLAPGAQLSFANADTDLAFNQAVNFLAASNDVVVDDLGFYGEAYDGTSSVSRNTADALNRESNRIRAYITSVGNSADEHYLGTYVDSGVDGPSISGLATPGRLHLFQETGDTTDVLGLGPQPHNVISLPANGEVLVFLTWDDRFGASGNNYDLYLVSQTTGRVVARSTDAQIGSQDPLEFIDYANNTGAADLFRIVVQNVRDSARPRQLNLYAFQPQCAAAGPRPLVATRHERQNYNTSARSVPAQSDAGGSPVSVISVGAICSAAPAALAAFVGSSTPDESCLDGTHSTIEFFSSRGPTIDGRVKPDVSSIDGVSITAAGRFVNPFFGTSAAAPHVAGIAALALQAAPCLVAGSSGALVAPVARAALRSLVVDRAVPLGSTVPDNIFGSGRADALASIERTLPVFQGLATMTVSGSSLLGATLTPAQLGFADPHQCAVTRLSWTGGCGTPPGSALNCPFGTTRVSVAASNNGVAFSSATELQITVTSFSVVPAPSSIEVTAGQSASLQITVAAQGGAFSNPVTLGCTNLPPGVACSFNPATMTPGASAASSALTISTTARGQSAAISSTFLLGCVFFGALIHGHYARRPRGAPHAILVVLVALHVACGRNTTGPPTTTTSSTTTTAPPTTTTMTTTTTATTTAPPSNQGTPPGTHQIAIAGVSGGLSQSAAVTIVVR